MKIYDTVINGDVNNFKKVFLNKSFSEKKYFINILYNYFSNGANELNENHKKIIFIILIDDKNKKIATHDNGFINLKFQKIISEIYLQIELTRKIKSF